MRFDVITLFPELFTAVSDSGVTGRAHRQGVWSLNTWNPRDYTSDVHHTVDDRPYGGGPGMVMLSQPLESALLAVRSHQQTGGAARLPVILMSPVGRRFDQAQAQMLAQGPGAVLLCGRYEGIDQRFIDQYVDDELSLGDFVLSGGEIAAMAIMDATVRLLPNVLHTADSAIQDSFQSSLSGLLDSPHYTRPEMFNGVPVPAVLSSGHHRNIARWRREASLRLTANRRPDLIVVAREKGWLSKEDEAFLQSLSSPGER